MERNPGEHAPNDSGQDPPELMFFESDRLINAGQINEAARLLMKLIGTYPDFGRAYNHLAFIYETKYRDYKQAETYYQKCLELAPDYTAVYLNYSILLSTQERHEELQVILEKALTCPGINRAKIWNEYGIMYEIQERYEEAIEAYRKAIRLSFIQPDIQSYKDSIQRVQEKKTFFEQGDSAFGVNQGLN